VFAQKDFQSLVEVCMDIRPNTFISRTLDNQKDINAKLAAPLTSLDLVDIETSQIEDLTAMRMRPDLLPYRRYIYIGEVSLDQRLCGHLGSAVSSFASRFGSSLHTIQIEFIAADRFEAIFSGVSIFLRHTSAGTDRDAGYVTKVYHVHMFLEDLTTPRWSNDILPSRLL